MAPPGEFAELDSSWRAGGKGYGDYKKKLLEYFHATFDAARQRREELRATRPRWSASSPTAPDALARSPRRSWNRSGARQASVSNCSESS